jgi:hypothetical protein
LKKEDIKNEIKKIVGKNYTIWTIGITDKPAQRKEQHKNDGKNTETWLQWKTDSEKDGRRIESYFIDKGMKGGTGGDTGAEYVYIF